jgi:hypothetical protein
MPQPHTINFCSIGLSGTKLAIFLVIALQHLPPRWKLSTVFVDNFPGWDWRPISDPNARY